MLIKCQLEPLKRKLCCVPFADKRLIQKLQKCRYLLKSIEIDLYFFIIRFTHTYTRWFMASFHYFERFFVFEERVINLLPIKVFLCFVFFFLERGKSSNWFASKLKFRVRWESITVLVFKAIVAFKRALIIFRVLLGYNGEMVFWMEFFYFYKRLGLNLSVIIFNGFSNCLGVFVFKNSQIIICVRKKTIYLLRKN